MTSFTVSTVIKQPIDIIVKALMNPNNFKYWQQYLARFEVIEKHPGEVGAIGHLHYYQKGRSYVKKDKLVYCEPGERYISEVTSDEITAQVDTTLHALGNETAMKITWKGKGKQFILKLLLPLMRLQMKRQSKKELATFKMLTETRGADFKT